MCTYSASAHIDRYMNLLHRLWDALTGALCRSTLVVRGRSGNKHATPTSAPCQGCLLNNLSYQACSCRPPLLSFHIDPDIQLRSISRLNTGLKGEHGAVGEEEHRSTAASSDEQQGTNDSNWPFKRVPVLRRHYQRSETRQIVEGGQCSTCMNIEAKVNASRQGDGTNRERLGG